MRPRIIVRSIVDKYPIAEKFVSVNGEGQHAGQLAAFIRFAGCNLNCSYCDTTWANGVGAASAHASLDELVAWVRNAQVACVTLTGGEPLLQPALQSLLQALLCVSGPDGGGLWVEIETNGALDLAPLNKFRSRGNIELITAGQAKGTLSFTVDYKLPSSGEEERMHLPNYALLGANDTVKFVCGSTSDLARVLQVCRQLNLPGRVPVYLSPVFGQLEPARIVAFMQQNHMSWARVQVQLHKIIWPNVEKGV